MERIIAVVGPTAVGKTALGIMIAEEVGGEIVSADSRQIYRGLNLGTGKVTISEMRGIPHHLIDVADPTEVFSASEYVDLGRIAISEIAARGHIPIVVGGTGFYIDTLVGRMTPADVPPNAADREQLAVYSLKELQEELKRLDPGRYATIDVKNPRRLIRAIEIARAPAVDRQLSAVSYDVLWLGVTCPLAELKQKIHERLLARLAAGMLDEAERLHSTGLTCERMESLGLEYRYMARHLKGEISYDAMVTQLEKEIVAYAKRQMTWFKKNKEIIWFTPEEKEKVIGLVSAFLK